MRAVTKTVWLYALFATLACAVHAQTNSPSQITNAALLTTSLEAEEGAAAAQFKLGMYFLNGKEVPGDLPIAAQWLRRAADQNHAAAQFNLAVLYSQGAGVARDLAEAANWFRRAADQDDPAAQYNLGTLYANGAGVAQDMAQAAAWFRKAAEKGDPKAQMAIAFSSANGTGTPVDLPEAYFWFTQAMAKGNRAAEDERDTVIAKMKPDALFRGRLRAAQAGDKEDQYLVGLAYSKAEGTPHDLAEAAKWRRQ